MSTQKPINFIGHQVHTYQVERLLRQRPHSALYLGRHLDDQSPIFLEVLHTTTQDDPQLAYRFRQRILTVTQLKHPYIAPIQYGDVTPDGYPYILITHTPGDFLDQKLIQWRRTPLAITESLTFGQQLADALSQAHYRNLVHHHLQPENIYVTENNTPLLIDLSVPTQMPPEPVEFATDGVLGYLSPEQAAGQVIDSRSNVYSLGILLYELLAGHRPRLPVSKWDIFRQQDTLPREIPLNQVRAGLTSRTYWTVKNCLWRHPADRLATARQVAAALEKAITAEQQQPPPTTTRPLLKRPLIGLIAIFILLLLAALAFFAWRQFNNQPGKTELLTATPTAAQTFTSWPTLSPSPPSTAAADASFATCAGDCPHLSLDLYPLWGSRCDNDIIYRPIFAPGQGGDGTYTYYWNDTQMAGPLIQQGFGFELIYSLV